MAASDIQSAGVIAFYAGTSCASCFYPSYSLSRACGTGASKRVTGEPCVQRVAAQLIEKEQAPGLYITKQWNNVLFDVTLLRVGNLVGLAAAQKIVFPLRVDFLLGVFAFVAAVTERPPWFLAPASAC